jgi:taspase, threonine aspartase, 1
MQSKDRTRVKGFIAVHIGAGYHSPINDKKNRILMRDALLAGSEHAKHTPNDPVSTLESIIRVLESSPHTNTVSHETVLYLCKGRGSNLNINGEVECDASIMSTPVESKSVFAGIALAKTMHPITTAKRLLDTNVFCGGRVKPLLVAGMDGLNKFISEEERGECITEEQKTRYKRMMKEVDNILKRKRENDATEKTEIDKLNDTVGAIYVSSSGHHVAGVSSGGTLLPY